MIELSEAIAVLDWTLTAACLAATITRPPRGCTKGHVLNNALAAHFLYLRQRVPTVHLATCALLTVDDPGSDNLAVLRLAGAVGLT